MSELTERLATTAQLLRSRRMGAHAGFVEEAIFELEKYYLLQSSHQAPPNKMESLRARLDPPSTSIFSEETVNAEEKPPEE